MKRWLFEQQVLMDMRVALRHIASYTEGFEYNMLLRQVEHRLVNPTKEVASLIREECFHAVVYFGSSYHDVGGRMWDNTPDRHHVDGVGG